MKQAECAGPRWAKGLKMDDGRGVLTRSLDAVHDSSAPQELRTRCRPSKLPCGCNSFYASCEGVFRLDLRHKPIVVLSNNDLSGTNY
jgi:hypothetical protein